MTRKVAILIFDDVEVLDFAGPFEVFNVTTEMLKTDPAPFDVYTVAPSDVPIYARGKLAIQPAYSLDTCPPPDILIVPGGVGTRPLLTNQTVLNWIAAQAERVELLLSVCTGSLLLGKLGLLDGLTVTTHGDNLDELRQLAPNAQVVGDQRYLDNGRIITAGGISAGIDMSLYVVHKLLGAEAIRAATTEMEYHWTPDTKQWNAD